MARALTVAGGQPNAEPELELFEPSSIGDVAPTASDSATGASDSVRARLASAQANGPTSLSNNLEEGGFRTWAAVSVAPLTVDFMSRQDGPSGESVAVSTQTVVLGTTAAASTAVSVGYVAWLLRGGSLFASLLASLPAWVSFDPLPILQSFKASEKAEEGQERLLDLVRERKQRGDESTP